MFFSVDSESGSSVIFEYGDDYNFKLYLTSSRELKLDYTNTTSTETYIIDSDIIFDRFYHFYCYFETDNIIVYLDGIKIIDSDSTFDFDSLAGEFIFGCTLDYDLYIAGSVDFIKIFIQPLDFFNILGLFTEPQLQYDGVYHKLINKFSDFYPILTPDYLFLLINTIYGDYVSNLSLSDIFETNVDFQTDIEDFSVLEDTYYESLTDNINKFYIDELQNNLYVSWINRLTPLLSINSAILAFDESISDLVGVGHDGLNIFKESETDLVDSYIDNMPLKSIGNSEFNSNLIDVFDDYSNFTESNTVKLALVTFVDNVLYEFINSDLFNEFLIDDVLLPLQTLISTKYSIKFNVYKNVEKLKIFFKSLLTNAVCNDKLFTSILTMITNECESIFTSSSTNGLFDSDNIMDLDDAVEYEKAFSLQYISLFNKYFIHIKLLYFLEKYFSGLKNQ
jgi:hypothetical protein